MTNHWANRSKSTLDGAITDSASSLTIVTPATGQDFPTAVPFEVICGTEIMVVGARAGNVLSDLTRGAEGTTAASHASGAVIGHGVTAGALTALQAATAVAGYYAPVTDASIPEILFDADGDVIVAWVTL